MEKSNLYSPTMEFPFGGFMGMYGRFGIVDEVESKIKTKKSLTTIPRHRARVCISFIKIDY